jgi:NTP pyrophosphatase (non-canonical NTP hydrolase)
MSPARMILAGERVSAQLKAVKLERLHQLGKWGVQTHSPAEWLAILAEEFGEVAKEVVDGVQEPRDLMKELHQVAAVAIAFAEALEHGDA